MMKLTRMLMSAVSLALLLCPSLLLAQTAKPLSSAIASAHPYATHAGLKILNEGGNAFDAAIAVTAMLAVVEPYSSGIGGGGFYLLHRTKDKKTLMLDAREVAPMAAHRDMYLDNEGQVIEGASLEGALAAAIPGIPAALVYLADHYGQLPLSVTLAPAITAAREGVEVDKIYHERAQKRAALLQRFPTSSKIFLPTGEAPKEGQILVQTDLANTLAILAKEGFKGFYEGAVANKLVEGVKKAGGIWTTTDLKAYRVKERTPIVSHYHGYTLVSAPPPSSGGVILALMLNQLKHFDLMQLSSTERAHTIVEVMKRAYRDRAEYLGDADFVAVPIKRLLSEAYAKALAASIDAKQATPSLQLKPAYTEEEGPHTTHFSIIDGEGNRVSATLSINYSFGSGFVPEGTGVLLNNEMDDFSIKPGVPNVYGLVGNEANAIAPGKRPLSSMTPTFIEGENSLAILGTPGGSRIITMVLLAALEFMQGSEPKQWVSLPRYHHQYLPDVIQHEPDTFSETEQTALVKKGHQLEAIESLYGNMHAILWEYKTNRVFAASDPRGVGEAAIGQNGAVTIGQR